MISFVKIKSQTMNKIALLLTTLILCVDFLQAQTTINPERIKRTIERLASDEMEGRETGTEGEITAAKYIARRLQYLELEPKGTKEFYQHFSVTPKANPHSENSDSTAEPIRGRNVIAFLDNKAENTIVLGAHFDHLGKGGEGSLYAGKEPQIHNGADDNASGVALMLSLAKAIIKREGLKGNNYLFIGFSGEEKGLWGSNYFCKNPTVDLTKINYMINFDMVGRLNRDKGLAINGVGTSPVWKETLNKANKSGLKLIMSESGVGPSDHTSFYLQDIPVLHFFTGQHEDYHKPSDDIEKINYKGIVTIWEIVLELIEALDDKGKIEFTKTKDESSSTPRFTVGLGVMPDYLFQGEGMRIDGVTDGRAASKAGFEKGDIVIQMGEDKVDGMQTYMEALSKYKKGDKTMVKVKRGEEIIEGEVVF